MAFLRSLRTVVWGEPAETKAERKLIVKLDWFILSFCCLMYWVNYLDRANLTNAYTTGMKEDLKMYGKQYNVINTIFYGGYVFGQIPQNIALQKLPPRIWFPLMMLCWGLFTLGTAFVQNYTQIMVIRFFQGACEASTFVGCQYILGSWYKSEELGKRTAIFTSSGLAGSMFSGFIQGGIYKNLNGHHGMAGWRWLFVIDFLITIPIAVYGYFIFPNTPETTTVKYLSGEERTLAITRLPEVVKKRGVLGWSLISRVLLSWQFWSFVSLWVFSSNTEMYSTNGILNIYLKSLDKYSVEQVDYIPTAVSGVGIVTTLLAGWYSDYMRARWHIALFLASTAVISGAIMLNPPSEGAKIFALMLNGCQYAGQTVFLAWANDRCRKDDAQRSVVLASMNMVATAWYLFWSLILYSATQAPMWRAGSIAMICMGICVLLTALMIHFLERRELKQEQAEAQVQVSEKAEEADIA